MDKPLSKELLQIGIVLGTVAIVFLVCRIKRLPIRETLGLYIPNIKTCLLWIGLYIPILILIDLAYYRFGKDFPVWEYMGYITVIRYLKIAVLGPIAEEVVFRGIMFNRISVARPGPIWAVIFTAIIFMGAHYSYSPLDMALVLIDGLYFGWVRYKTGSIFIPIILHMLANSIAVAEFLFVNSHMLK